jgi:crotonobetainyl-CoA:carnitine CoA-transferase CaiB-like acyl-CoA transferase
VAIACRDDADWVAFGKVIDEPWTADPRWAHVDGRRAAVVELDELVGAWTRRADKFATQQLLLDAGVPAAAVQTPEERIDHDPSTRAWGLWPEARHPGIGTVRVDGIPLHLSETDWQIDAGAPRLGQHNHDVFGGLLGLDAADIADLEAAGDV